MRTLITIVTLVLIACGDNRPGTPDLDAGIELDAPIPDAMVQVCPPADAVLAPDVCECRIVKTGWIVPGGTSYEAADGQSTWASPVHLASRNGGPIRPSVYVRSSPTATTCEAVPCVETRTECTGIP